MNNPNKVFINAVCGGDCEMLELAIASGADINALVERNQFDYKPVVSVGDEALQLAISATKDRELRPEHLHIIRRLIEIGVDVNSQYMLDVSSRPIHKAVHTKHKEIFDLLVELGATFDGYELIRWAGYYGLDWLVVQFLEIVKDSVADERITHGLEQALCGAARQGHLEIVRKLLDFGVNVDAREHENTALIGAAAGGHKDIADLLIARGADIHAVGDRGLTVLISAAQGHLTELGLQLLEEGSDVNATNFSQRTSLHGAAEAGDEVLARELVRRGANLKARESGNDTVLHSAGYGGNRWIIEACLEAGENVNAQDNWGYTPLMSAAKAGHIDAMEVLVRAGANVNHVAHYEGETALYYAIAGKQMEAVRWLLERGANAEVVVADPAGTTNLLGLAAEKNDVDLARLLIRFGAQPAPNDSGCSPPLHCAAWHNSLEMLSFLLSLGVPVDSRDEEDNAPLRCAISPEAVRILLEAGADPNERESSCGFTKLWVAALYDSVEEGEILLEYGADPLLRDTLHNKTPYEVALENDSTRFVRMLDEYFERKGISV